MGLFTCISILDNTFLEWYPIHVRRKQFFDARQKEGQTAIKFREELLSLLEEADGVNIGCDNLICMMLQIGLSDSTLQRELGTVRIPPWPSSARRLRVSNKPVEPSHRHQHMGMLSPDPVTLPPDAILVNLVAKILKILPHADEEKEAGASLCEASVSDS